MPADRQRPAGFAGKHFCRRKLNFRAWARPMGREMFYGTTAWPPASRPLGSLTQRGFERRISTEIGQRGELPRPKSHCSQRWSPLSLPRRKILMPFAASLGDQSGHVLVVSSVANGAGSTFPKLLAHSYNGMSAGIIDVDGSIDGPISPFETRRGPRVKPDSGRARHHHQRGCQWLSRRVPGRHALIRLRPGPGR